MTMAGRGDGREQGGDRQGDVLPMLGAIVFVGAIGGALTAMNFTLLVPSSKSLSTQMIFGAALGAIFGLFAGMTRSVWRLGLPLRTSVPEPRREPGPSPPELWDPWLDSGRDSQGTESAPEAAVTQEAQIEGLGSAPAERARVRPRIISRETSEAILLEDEIGPLVQSGRCGLFVILGGPGSGKTTALRHLAAILPPWAYDRVRLVEDRDLGAVSLAYEVTSRLVILFTDSFPAKTADQVLVQAISHLSSCHFVVHCLGSWSNDDLIEYLLSAHRDQCASVMSRLKASGDPGFLKGIPELCAIVLDEMARDESIGDVRTALRRALAERLDDRPALRKPIEDICLTAIGENTNRVPDLSRFELRGDGSTAEALAAALLRLIRHRPVGLLLAADRIASMLEDGLASMSLARQLPRELIDEAALRIADNTLALHHLNDWLIRSYRCQVHPMAASLLHAATPGWRPQPACRPRLCGAYLDHASWSGLDLEGVDLQSADLGWADLSRANLEKANVSQARFHRANLRKAILNSWVALGADLSGADLRSVLGRSAGFVQANLSDACLTDAHLRGANLRGANIEDADFRGAKLEYADLSGLKLRSARFDGAQFGGADLHQCDLEGMELTDADFHDANLSKALLTGSRMSRANFSGANLREAGLAEVDWPGANLRDADLRDASFHLGTTRSGLVGSPIACEGSRTGFYTDDYHDQEVKPAEEIRKANLRGADLRGAQIENVDFYLVDLRDAKYTPDQAEHLRRCRAILEDRGG
jgi:uncharacterized protein YjbI with pentapeptide repeats/energy-coupling factor transporter ATP-binding protein EcfA2